MEKVQHAKKFSGWKPKRISDIQPSTIVNVWGAISAPYISRAPNLATHDDARKPARYADDKKRSQALQVLDYARWYSRRRLLQ